MTPLQYAYELGLQRAFQEAGLEKVALPAAIEKAIPTILGWGRKLLGGGHAGKVLPAKQGVRAVRSLATGAGRPRVYDLSHMM